ncbi:alpha/beta fold hydrolase [Pedobacter panaciterrae]|uniref:Alpha/beta fold hydrolase n=1 Tax=Pedobacter panaciterrae TaxID=363849 RepID=A0ABU8NHL6_9SPHI
MLLVAVGDLSFSTKGFAQSTFKADSVVFSGATTGLQYGATITLPQDNRRKHTAVIIVSGTGQQDRDGTMAGHKIFAAIAGYLSQNGIVVLRVDDRGVGKSTGNYIEATTADFAADIQESFAYLSAREDVDPGKIGVLGHSEGGASCAIAASREPKIAFLISMAGLCLDGYQALMTQNRDLVNNAPISGLDKQRYHNINKLMFQTVRLYADSANLAQRLNAVYDEWKKNDDVLVKKEKIEFDHFRFPIYSYAKQATTAWYRYFIKYDPAPVLAKVRIPVLALNGDKDLMVSHKEHLANWKRLPGGGSNKDVTTYVLPGLNHLFLPCQKCTVQEYPTITQPVSVQALRIITDWINKRF